MGKSMQEKFLLLVMICTSSGQPVVTPTNELLLRNRDGFLVPVQRRRVLDLGAILSIRSTTSRTLGRIG